MLAMVVNDNACCLMARVALASIASMLAPAGVGAGHSVARFAEMAAAWPLTFGPFPTTLTPAHELSLADYV